jgi:hypothetical protein
MKTTIEMPDALYEEARAWAAQNGWTIEAVIEESVRQFLETRRAARETGVQTWRPVVFEGQGLQTSGITFTEMLALAERPQPLIRTDESNSTI